ncbi:hypothetical protein PS1M3_11360 [Pseudoalteromonas sp. PS1M3]|uniref:DUF2290 domain-containing protein n=1 Tax=Pseudoalteromonas sp. PS1M3 TaxID=87791 RepID=UPI00194F399D|nr:DUF2290 domain-containing protein [Pseudoalteromonas sp. PS1M3]BBW91049.1 hypothetical protein PS1M3_11360 [Pseudoalteromonas sp. PS1M3]
MRAKDVLKDIGIITSKLIEIGLSVDQNFPRQSDNSGQQLISYDNYSDTSVALKNIEYKEIYGELDKERQFNIKLLDGALLQFFYCFEGNTLIKHRLCYFPSPDFESFQNEPELYLDESKIYADILLKSVLPIPIRFDYAPNDSVIVEHPSSHLTLGQYKNCRIPVESAICPSSFTNFILRAFYMNGLTGTKCVFTKRELEACLHDEERPLLYISP